MPSDADRPPEAYRRESNEPHIRYANRFLTRFVTVTIVVTLLNATLLRGDSPLVNLLTLVVSLAASWFLVHLLFDGIDGLITERLAENDRPEE